MYEKVISMLRDGVGRYLRKENLPGTEVPIHLVRPPTPGLGDYSSNVALALSEKTGKDPVEVAEGIARLVDPPAGLLEEGVAVAGKGFLNFKIKIDNWYELVPLLRSRGESFFEAPVRTGKKILVEFVSANPTGPLHVGHGRGAVLGDSIVKILKAAGNEAAAEYYVNDRGRQVRSLGVSIHFRYNEILDSNFPEPDGEDWYIGSYVVDLAEDLRSEYGDSLRGRGPHDPIFREFGVERMLRRLKEDLEALGIAFDSWFRESSIEEETLQKIILDLEHRGCARRQEDGSVVFKYDAGGSEDEKERILVKKDGDYTYFATDIPYHLDKFRRGHNELVNVWGADHHGYIPRMRSALAAFGHDPALLRVVLVQMVSLARGGRPIKMSKRAGEFVTLREIVDEVGRDAFRFIFLTRRSDSHFQFDVEEAKKQNLLNPVFHVQYGHARLSSILRRARERLGLDAKRVPSAEVLRLLGGKLTLEEENETLKNALRMGEVINDAARTLQPHRVASFVMDLSKDLQSYYTTRWRVHGDPILPPESAIGPSGAFPEDWDVEKTLARLIWVDSVRIAMKAGLGLLGVAAPERMERIEEDVD